MEEDRPHAGHFETDAAMNPQQVVVMHPHIDRTAANLDPGVPQVAQAVPCDFSAATMLRMWQRLGEAFHGIVSDIDAIEGFNHLVGENLVVISCTKEVHTHAIIKTDVFVDLPNFVFLLATRSMPRPRCPGLP